MQYPNKSPICMALIASLLLLSPAVMFAAVKQASDEKSSYKEQKAVMPVTCPSPLTLKDGLYVGAKGLYDAYSIRSTTIINNPLGSGYGFSSTTAIAANGWGGGLFAGYGIYSASLFYIGAEGFINGTSASQRDSYTGSGVGNTTSDNDLVSARMSWGISILPGYKVSDASLFFIRLGYVQTRLKGKQDFSTTLRGGIVASSRVEAWQSGFNYGLGIETALTQNISLRGETSHIAYITFNNKISRYNPSDNQYSLGLIYHFT